LIFRLVCGKHCNLIFALSFEPLQIVHFHPNNGVLGQWQFYRIIQEDNRC
jgi:hypothetical protein